MNIDVFVGVYFAYCCFLFCMSTEAKGNIRFASKNNLYKPRYRTNTGRRTVSSMVTDIWLDLPLDIKQIQNTKNFQLESEKSIAI